VALIEMETYHIAEFRTLLSVSFHNELNELAVITLRDVLKKLPVSAVCWPTSELAIDKCRDHVV
jgi:hypothetical protein